MFHPQQPNAEIVGLLQQVSGLQYHLQSYQTQNAQLAQQLQAAQQEMSRLQTQIRDSERRVKTYVEKYNNVKEQNQSLQGEVKTMREEVNRKTAQVNDYAERERIALNDEKRARKRAFDQNKPYQPASSLQDHPPPKMGHLKIPSAMPSERQRDDYGKARAYQTINPSTMAALSANFREMNPMGSSGNRRHVSYSTVFAAPAVHNADIQKSALSVRENNQDPFGTMGRSMLRVPQGNSGLPDKFWDKVILPEDVPGTFAHTEQMLVKFKSRDEKMLELATEFDLLMQETTKWTSTFIKTNGPVELRDADGQNRWELLKALVHPMKEDHAEKLVLDLTSGPHVSYVAAAMIWRYLQKRVLVAQVLLGTGPKTMANVVDVDEELRNTRTADMAPSRRAKLVAVRKATVEDIVKHAAYFAVRHEKVKDMTKELCNLLQPFIVPRDKDGRPEDNPGLELSRLVFKAFDLSVTMLLQDGIFVFQVPGVGERFMASTMRLLPHSPPSSRHDESLRPAVITGKLRLCVTAGVTFRDDTAGNIYVKQISKASVLCEYPRTSPAAQQ